MHILDLLCHPISVITTRNSGHCLFTKLKSRVRVDFSLVAAPVAALVQALVCSYVLVHTLTI